MSTDSPDSTTRRSVERASTLAPSSWIDLARRAWAYEPAYDVQLSWRSAGSALLRCVCCGALLFALLTPLRLRPHIDLYPTYVAGLFANEGRWDRIYHRTIWLHNAVDPEWDKRAAEVTKEQLHGTSFVYHPWYLQLVRPFVAYTTYPQFQRGTVVFNKVCIVLGGLAISALLGASTLPVQALATLLLGVGSATIYGLEFGQNVLPALVLSLGAALAWASREKLWLGGLLAALAWTCKPWCSLLLLLCFALRGVRAGVITSVALAFVMGLLPSLVMPAELMRDYQALNLQMTNVSVSGFNNFSILVTIERLTHANWAAHMLEWLPRQPLLWHRLAALGVAGGVLVLSALIWWRREPRVDYTIAALLAFLLLPLGICWTHYFIFALPLGLLGAFGSDSRVALRVLGFALLVELVAITEWAGIPNDRFASFFADPPRYPWREALPIVLVIAGILGSLLLAPARTREGRDTC